jgi:hypothetical protein
LRIEVIKARHFNLDAENFQRQGTGPSRMADAPTQHPMRGRYGKVKDEKKRPVKDEKLSLY